MSSVRMHECLSERLLLARFGLRTGLLPDFFSSDGPGFPPIQLCTCACTEYTCESAQVIRRYAYTGLWLHTRMQVRMYIRVCMSMSVYVCEFVYACVCMGGYTWVNVYSPTNVKTLLDAVGVCGRL